MRKVHLFIGLAIMLLGTSVAVGQNNFRFVQCDPCAPLDACGNGNGGFFTPFTFGGWIEMGIYSNSRGFSNNGPMHTSSRRRTDFNMSQLYLFAEREMDASRGFDWGARADFVYGSHAGSMQTYDGSFDSGWGANRHGYEMSAYKLYGTLGYKDLSVKAGKFGTPIGWEGSASLNNIFYSHSDCYWIEPATHMGVVADYNLTDRLMVSAGWVTGMDSSFKNPDNNRGILAGFEYALSNNANIYYYFSGGVQSEEEQRYNYFVQSVCLEWDITDRFTYVFQYNLRNDNERGGEDSFSTYGINNHFLYSLNDRWTAGVRFEWLRDNGGFGYFSEEAADYYQLSLGLNWNPRPNVNIRPEIRHDWCRGATPFGESRSTQFSGGCGVIISF
jgi:hypothetical protein